ncbi:MAG TPA: DUF1343 domain-containing protein [Pyrinomonadaceae bacterium]|jgi:uncharacterized protein YbbC (DUF1343 family)|nr:DUF1343 domain-containing protein [Pyrinomonadaceae bacterium]
MTLTIEQEREAEILKGLRQPVQVGLEVLLQDVPQVMRGKRVGLICNQSSVNHTFEHAADLLHEHSGFKLTTLFGPQHGIRGDVQDNMIETAHGTDRKTGLPVHSLYSETREPTEKMLEDLDVLVFDMQDVGCRIYTFVYTLANCMRIAGRLGKPVVVCDRPNPINGLDISGNILEPEYASFVGLFPLPTRHGMTVGELAQMFRDRFDVQCDLHIVPMVGWKRQFWLDETDAPWVLPSPNMPTLDTATVFPGAVHFEGTQISEGRGTTKPFELIGAPYIDPDAYADKLTQLSLPGVIFRSCAFQPTFQKHAKVTCGGVQIHVVDRDRFDSVLAGIAMVKVAHDMYPGEFRWKEPPYEYVFDKNPFDVISGTNKIREAFEQGVDLDTIRQGWQAPLAEFETFRAPHLLYR